MEAPGRSIPRTNDRDPAAPRMPATARPSLNRAQSGSYTNSLSPPRHSRKGPSPAGQPAVLTPFGERPSPVAMPSPPKSSRRHNNNRPAPPSQQRFHRAAGDYRAHLHGGVGLGDIKLPPRQTPKSSGGSSTARRPHKARTAEEMAENRAWRNSGGTMAAPVDQAACNNSTGRIKLNQAVRAQLVLLERIIARNEPVSG